MAQSLSRCKTPRGAELNVEPSANHTGASIVAPARGCWLSLKLGKGKAMMMRSLLIMPLVYLCSQGSNLVNASNRVIAA
ncbi:hypothetical protein H6F86_13100 [Phormidium sp. FACHB-592]|uniref:Uncharacterized protein n=1 Tax=Stenomitos frigidus AS-A4 TaxID=2933935 RepID=A0ABV0KJ54_9CYAN|nr:hypothetical protein [Phormidium sp. FACHB-592]MBD2074812.1 hypothetical protein [Phormidium sp. FACHB-592]